MGISIMETREALWAEQCKSLQPMRVPHPLLTDHGVFTKRLDMYKSKCTKSGQRSQSTTAWPPRVNRLASGRLRTCMPRTRNSLQSRLCSRNCESPQSYATPSLQLDLW